MACGMRLIRGFFAIAAAVLVAQGATAASVLPPSLPLDANGWTVFTPSADSRIIYVSNAGNDATGQAYSPGDPALGGNPFNPTGAINAFATYSAARALARDGYPDWILFRRGDTFSAQILKKTGRSSAELALVGAYGASGAMPVIYPLNATTVPVQIVNTFGYFAVTSLDFYNTYRDPKSPNYQGIAGAYGLWIYAGPGDVVQQVIVEGCKFRFFQSNVIQNHGGTMTNITFRRNVVLDDYWPDGGTNGHGVYAADINTFLFEENILDHNGWLNIGEPQAAFRHGTYLTGMTNATFRRNIITRSCSGGSKFASYNGEPTGSNIDIDDNLYIDGEIGISIGMADISETNLNITNNVITNVDRTSTTGRGVGWAIWAGQIATGTISGNLCMNWYNAASTNTNGIMLHQSLSNVSVQDNVVYALNPYGTNPGSSMFNVVSDSPQSGILVTGNQFQEPSHNVDLISFSSSPAPNLSALTFSGNTYYSTNQSAAFLVGSTTYSYAGWSGVTSDNSKFGSFGFPDPSRSIETYMTSLGMQGTIDAFIAACRNNGRYSWDNRFTADTVNSWLRAGFWPSLGSPSLRPLAPSGLRVVP
jgi:hypothetical protein